jgi:hypothetical protein
LNGCSPARMRRKLTLLCSRNGDRRRRRTSESHRRRRSFELSGHRQTCSLLNSGLQMFLFSLPFTPSLLIHKVGCAKLINLTQLRIPNHVGNPLLQVNNSSLSLSQSNFPNSDSLPNSTPLSIRTQSLLYTIWISSSPRALSSSL